jgi:hypothetical protein
MAHSNQLREFVLTNRGLDLVDPMRDGHGRVLTGARRLARDTRVWPVRTRLPTRTNGR